MVRPRFFSSAHYIENQLKHPHADLLDRFLTTGNAARININQITPPLCQRCSGVTFITGNESSPAPIFFASSFGGIRLMVAFNADCSNYKE
jgi:hypothetical protein